RDAVDGARVDLRVVQRGHHGIAHEGEDRLPRLRMAHIGRLADAHDGGVLEHAFLWHWSPSPVIPAERLSAREPGRMYPPTCNFPTATNIPDAGVPRVPDWLPPDQVRG